MIHVGEDIWTDFKDMKKNLLELTNKIVTHQKLDDLVEIYKENLDSLGSELYASAKNSYDVSQKITNLTKLVEDGLKKIQKVKIKIKNIIFNLYIFKNFYIYKFTRLLMMMMIIMMWMMTIRFLKR